MPPVAMSHLARVDGRVAVVCERTRTMPRNFARAMASSHTLGREVASQRARGGCGAGPSMADWQSGGGSNRHVNSAQKMASHRLQI